MHKDQNILKKYCYSYQGQQEECQANSEPMWQSTGQIRCKPCPQNSNYLTDMQQHEERDNNAASATYGTTRWVDDGVPGACAITSDWQNTTTAVRCRVVNGVYTSELEQEQRDLNPCSGTYYTTRWIVVGTNCATCPKPQVWVVESTSCQKDASGNNTGYQDVVERNTEPCSPGYNTTRPSIIWNPSACPQAVYARLDQDNIMYYATYTSADVTVRFFSNSQGTTPLSVSGLAIGYSANNSCTGNSSYVVSCYGSAQVLEEGAWIDYTEGGGMDCPPEELCNSCPPDELCDISGRYCFVDYFLNSRSGYTIIY